MGKSLTPQESVYPYKLWQKERMFEHLESANVFLGNLDLSFFLAYAFGLFVSGYICDRVNLRYMLTFGLWGSAVCTCLFGYISVILEIRNEIFYIGIFFLNGIIQSAGRPASVAIMGNWFTKSSSGLVFGLWSCSGSMGNVIGSLMVASAIEYGYEYGMLMVSLFSFCAGIISLTCIIPHPNNIGIRNPDQAEPNIPLSTIADTQKEATQPGASNSMAERTSTKIDNKPVKFYEACLIPGVIQYALANACLKMVNYAFLFWLPTYLAQGLHIDDKTSDNLSNLYDVGGMLGGIAAGVISDFLGYRAPVLSIMLLLSLGSVYMYQHLGTTYLANILLMVLTGFLLGGPANTISATIAADLGKHEKLKSNSGALGTVTGIVEGTGSVGAAIGQRYVAVIQREYGWPWVFYALMVTTGMSIVLILPILIKEIKRIFRKYTQRELST